MNFEKGIAFAQKQDKQDELREYRKQFYIPTIEGKPALYFCGNSLGLQPKVTKFYLEEELLDWRNLGVEGHHNAKNPWFSYHHFFTEEAKLVGAEPDEVVMMNALSVNLHLLLTSFYRPEGKRTKIIMEAGAFPSDQYAVETQMALHGINYKKDVIEIAPKKGAYTLETQDIVAEIKKAGDELALVLFSGVQYLTGQFFEMETITEAGHKAGAMVGFDLAHAVGNVPMQLHDWNVDFAVWCTYKYLNSGPGGVGGAFVHKKHGNNPKIPRLGGWWGNNEETRFEMKKGFKPQAGAAGWQISNAPVLSMAAHKASLEIFNEVGMPALREKSLQLTGYLEFLLKDNTNLTIITPANPEERGCQLSLVAAKDGKQIHGKLKEQGIIADWREPNVIRAAPVPLYNSFEDVYHLAEILNS